MISSKHFLLPVPEEYVDNYKVWGSFHYTESIFKYHPIADKAFFTKFSYKLLRSACPNRVAAFGATLVRIAILQTGFFEDPMCQCIITVKAAEKLVKYIPDDFISESSSSSEFLAMVKCLQNCISELISCYIEMYLYMSEVTWNTYLNTIKRICSYYGVEENTLIASLHVGMSMLTKDGMRTYESFSEQEYNVYNNENVMQQAVRNDNFLTYSVPSSIPCKERVHKKVSDRVLQARLYRKLYRAMKQYDRAYAKYQYDRHAKRRDGIRNYSKPVFDPIFLFYSYRKFKFKNIVCKI